MMRLKFSRLFKNYVEELEKKIKRSIKGELLRFTPLFSLVMLACFSLLVMKIGFSDHQNPAIAQENEPMPLVQQNQTADLTSDQVPSVVSQESSTSAPDTPALPVSIPDAAPRAADEKKSESPRALFNPMTLTPNEIQVLESLADRRKELEEKEKKMGLRMALLQASEQRIEQKVETLQGLKTAIESLLKRYDVQEQENFKVLAKIYEKMKPKEAARIFSELEMPILLNVMTQMKDSKASQIIAFMETNQARDLTLAIAKERRLKNEVQQKLDATSPAEKINP